MIGKNIKRIRLRKGMTLSELAERAQISKSYLSNIERNLNQNPSIQIMEKIASVLGVDFRMLIETESTNDYIFEEEWVEFVNALKKSGVRKDQLPEYKMVIEFATWQNKRMRDL